MTKQEFENLIESPVSGEDWKLIEFVYMWHPNIGNVTGKQQMAELYKAGGVEIFKDMRRAASIHKDYEDKVADLRRQIFRLESEIEEVRNAYEEEIELR